MPKQLKQTDQARADQQTTREYSRLFSLTPGTRFSKVPLTLRARNQIFKSRYKEYERRS